MLGIEMADVLTSEQRKRCMANIQAKNSKPEMIVRRLLHSMGFRYRLHRKDLPGTPDIVLVRLKKIILVHGCFWHMHDCPYGRVNPKTNSEFWRTKRLKTVARDAQVRLELKRLGWEVLEVWECQTRQKNLESLLACLHTFLSMPRREGHE